MGQGEQLVVEFPAISGG